MLRILILGGTGWLGSRIAERALAAGAEVVCLARGQSGPVPDGARLVRADRTQPEAYEQLTGSWDDVVDLTDRADHARSALERLADNARHWTFVSSVSVYARHDLPGADETADVIEPADLSQFPDAKVAAENVCRDLVGDRLLIARPGLIAGPGDPSDRFGYWPARLHRGGRVLSPTTAERWVQVIDVADLASWLVRAGLEGRTGIVDAVGEAHPLGEVLAEASRLTGGGADVVQAEDARLLANGVSYWAGPRSLPLWVPSDHAGMMRRSGARYLASGGTRRPLRATLQAVLADELDRGRDRPRRSGMSAGEEAAVLGALEVSAPSQ